MMDVNQTPPEKMTPAQRRQEIAMLLLANGLIRLRSAGGQRHAGVTAESEFELDSSGHGSLHSNPVNKTKTESK